uniref:Uncharacterized protein n=1 Tax=Rhizophora mucronata TaxID=61149 RepID=A0A2P2Q2K6_RHIMU
MQIGVGIGNDCVKVFKDYNISVKAVEDLSCLANRKLGGEPRVWGLQSLTELLVCKEWLVDSIDFSLLLELFSF